jgi:hypothetical protein
MTPAVAQQVAIDNNDIGGVVTGANGPEAGVWVIAETRELPTRFIKIAVTDDRGRYVIPDLPRANYDIWVRGYGLVDSPKQKSAPGKNLDLKAVPARAAPRLRSTIPRNTGSRWSRCRQRICSRAQAPPATACRSRCPIGACGSAI